MKSLAVLAVVLLAVIAYRLTFLDAHELGRQIGLGILTAQAEEVHRISEVHSKAAEHANKVDAATELLIAQERFDALPKWDSFGRPINRIPPNGLHPTEKIPAAPLGTYGNPIR